MSLKHAHTQWSAGMPGELLARDARSFGRVASAIENNTRQGQEILRALSEQHAQAPGGHVIGITGAPGVGKSTTVAQLAKYYADQGDAVGIIAVDPSSPFTKGALLGDRVRMSDLNRYANIQIRSMATRGSLGGLASATYDMVHLFRYMGKDKIIVETVGVGQAEVDICHVADTVVVITVPGLGDDIQAIKAGLFEIADIFIVNKYDKPHAQKAKQELEFMIHNRPDARPITVLPLQANQGQGIADLSQEIARSFQHVLSHPHLRSSKMKEMLTEMVRKRVLLLAEEHIEKQDLIDNYAEQVIHGQVDLYSAIHTILSEVSRHG